MTGGGLNGLAAAVKFKNGLAMGKNSITKKANPC